MREFIAALGLGGLLVGLGAGQGVAAPFSFDSGPPTNQIATATRPSNVSKFEIESADDFILNQPTRLTSASFTGLINGTSTVSDINHVVVEIYRVFPALSDVGRTSGSPMFSTPQVPTRVNSPADGELEGPRQHRRRSLLFRFSLGEFLHCAQQRPTPRDPSSARSDDRRQRTGHRQLSADQRQLPRATRSASRLLFLRAASWTKHERRLFVALRTRPIIPPFTPDLQS
jgi:hypothetical protein